MKIENEKQAQEMIDLIGNWLNAGVPNHKHRDRDSWGREKKQAHIAREFASSLLEDANVEDMGGCPLCQG